MICVFRNFAQVCRCVAGRALSVSLGESPSSSRSPGPEISFHGYTAGVIIFSCLRLFALSGAPTASFQHRTTYSKSCIVSVTSKYRASRIWWLGGRLGILFSGCGSCCQGTCCGLLSSATRTNRDVACVALVFALRTHLVRPARLC